jgi:predicted metal-dependent phosphoesterase TrpH
MVTAAPAGWVKGDFHMHSCEDPHDHISHRAVDLIERAHQLSFDVIAITLHDHVLTQAEAFARAAELGVLLVPGAEMRIEGADVVILNITEEEAATLRTFDDLRHLRGKRGASLLTFAPHPFFRLGGSIGPRVSEHLDCFDALEYCHFHTRWMNLNKNAVRLAKTAGKPLLATSDAHELRFFGDHYSLVRASAQPPIQEVFASIRAGRVRQVSPAWQTGKFLRHLLRSVTVDKLRKLGSRL